MRELWARVMVATPTYTGSVAFECACSMQVATILCLGRGVLLEWVLINGFSLVQVARDWLAAEFLSRPEFTHLMWLDDDVGFSPDGIIKLLESNLDIVGGVYPVKNDGSERFCYMPTGPAIRNLQPVTRLPGGFVLARRHVVQEVAARCEWYDVPFGDEWRKTAHIFDVILIDDPQNPARKIVLGEDYLFCQRALDAGFSLYARTDIDFAHVGRHAWTGGLSEHRLAKTA